mgnify:CR=1 FL=1
MEVFILKKILKFKYKSIVIFCIIVFIILLGIHNLENSKRTNMNYSAKQYLTTGFFNNYKLYTVDYYHLTFSDTKNAILEVQGMEYKIPHKTVKYRMMMQKDNKGIWSVKTLVPLSNIENANESN